MVAINEDDMVDDARDMILRKYANSLGKSFDSPDVNLRIHPREQGISASQRSGSAQQMPPSPLQEERVLRPDEVLSRTLDVYFPGGQSVEEALLIDVPPPPQSSHRTKRTPRHSPGVFASHTGHFASHAEESYRPSESDKDYFTAAVLNPGRGSAAAHSPGHAGQSILIGPGGHPSIAVINGGQLPALPSPSAADRAMSLATQSVRRHTGRPKVGRTHTSSPTIVQSVSHLADARPNIATAAAVPPPPLGTPPHPPARATTPPARVSSPRPPKPRRPKKVGTNLGSATPGPSSGLLATVPPINVLVVEDNIINLRLLEAFLKRLKVRSHSAMNGREAVNKWRQGGFHLVLMDIQLPVMNGLEATKEIRRLEKVNGVGAFVKSIEEERAEKGRQTQQDEKRDAEPTTPQDEEKERERNHLGNRELFKSPVIIVALTASSLHSDRSEALAAGCNDFLTKPVNLAWLERKLKEWGCMQALIDFDGWREWKDFQSAPADTTSAGNKGTGKGAGHRTSNAGSGLPGLKLAQRSDSASVNKSVPSSKDPAAIASGATAPPAANATASALQDLNARNDSQDSTTTLDSMTSDDADSIDTAMPTRPSARRVAAVSSPLGPNISVQAPTPRQSVEGANLPRVDTALAGTRSTSGSPKIGTSGASPRSLSSLSLSSAGDGQGDTGSDRDRSTERRRRTKRSSLGHSGLTAVEEREGEETKGEVKVGA